MAKLALINREEKRRKMVAQYAKKRAALEAIITNVSLSDEERYEAPSEIPGPAAQFQPVPSAQSLPADRPSAWCFP